MPTLFPADSKNESMLVENVVAQQLVASDHSLFFYSSFDRKDSSNRMVVDFLIDHPYSDAAMRSRVSLVVVKSPRQCNTSSLDKFKRKFGQRVGTLPENIISVSKSANA